MKRFLNDDVVIIPCRTAAWIDEGDLHNKIIEEARKYKIDPSFCSELKDKQWTEEMIASHPTEYLEYCVQTLLECDSAIMRDSDIEGTLPYLSVSVHPNDDNIMGFHMVDTLTFFGFEVWPLDDCSFIGIVYWDGERIRFYIPRWGNCINTSRMSVLYHNDCGDWDEDRAAYYAKYDIDYRLNKYDFRAMRRDISTAIQVI